MKIFPNNYDFIGQFVAYFGDILKSKEYFIIPYFNIEVIEGHPLYINDKITYIDKSYWVFKNIKKIIETIYPANSEIIINKNTFEGDSNYEIFQFGADLFKSKLYGKEAITFEWEIWAESCFLQLLDDSQLSNELFIPFGTPKLKTNIDLKNVIDFIENKQLPDNLKKLIENDNSTIVKTYGINYNDFEYV